MKLGYKVKITHMKCSFAERTAKSSSVLHTLWSMNYNETLANYQWIAKLPDVYFKRCRNDSQSSIKLLISVSQVAWQIETDKFWSAVNHTYTQNLNMARKVLLNEASAILLFPVGKTSKKCNILLVYYAYRLQHKLLF